MDDQISDEVDRRNSSFANFRQTHLSWAQSFHKMESYADKNPKMTNWNSIDDLEIHICNSDIECEPMLQYFGDQKSVYWAMEE